MSSVEADYWYKENEDLNRVKQLKKMIKRTREKYRSGPKHNDIIIDRHQYYLIPPKLQQKDRLWRCVHIILGQNDYFLEPLNMSHDQAIAGLERRIKDNEVLATLSEEEIMKGWDEVLKENKLI